MSFVLVAPDVLETAATDAAQIGSAVKAGHLAAAISTTELAAAGADEVSAAIAELFGAHAQAYHAAAAQAETHYEQFVRTLSAAAASYAGAEATIAASMQGALGEVTAPARLLGGPLYGGAANAASLAGPGSTVSNDLQTFLNGPISTISGAWINSPLGRVLDQALFGTGATGGNQQSIVIDFVRHGQSVGNTTSIIDTTVPGTGLTALGLQQAQTIATALVGQGPFAGIFASQLIRTQQTAALLVGPVGVPALPGLNEIDAGIFQGLPSISPAGILYLVGPAAWTLGLPIVPMLAPGSAHLNGVVFDQGFTNALQTMYATTMANPVHAANGQITDVAYSSEFAIEVGTLMNVNNPDPLLMFTHPLPNTGVVVVQGSPQGGWTMVSWDGVPVGPATLPTKLFVDVRNLITAPQFAVWNSLSALGTGDPTTIVNSVGNGVDQVAAATVQFPLAVTRDLVHAVTNTSLSGLSTELTGLLP
jgi:PE family/Histidine phosphatase superfamily (branch 1)